VRWAFCVAGILLGFNNDLLLHTSDIVHVHIKTALIMVTSLPQLLYPRRIKQPSDVGRVEGS
jgi:hypothetical protein